MTSGANGPREPSVEMRARDRWLEVRAEGGPGDAGWLAGLFRLVAERVSREPADAVVIDVRGSIAPLTTTERYRLGEDAAVHWPGVPVAVIGSAGIVEPERFAEMVARSRGVDGRVFTDENEARAWLTGRVAARAAGGPRQ